MIIEIVGTIIAIGGWIFFGQTLSEVLKLEKAYGLTWNTTDTFFCIVFIIINVIMTSLAIYLWLPHL